MAKFKLGQNIKKFWRQRAANNAKPKPIKSENMNPEIKNPFASKTIWGAILVVIGLIGRLVGFDVPKEEISSLFELVSANWDNIMQIVGAVLTVWGRFSAKAKIGFSKS